jgi:hypothetical protein
MLWNTQTLDPNVMTLVDDTGTLGVVSYNPQTQRYLASTQKTYLGTFSTLAIAQKAVETKCKVEMKGSGMIIVAGGM